MDLVFREGVTQMTETKCVAHIRFYYGKNKTAGPDSFFRDQRLSLLLLRLTKLTTMSESHAE
jgi:hypothetical protein